MNDRLQVVLGPVQDSPRVAHVPAVLRAAYKIAEDIAPGRLVLWGAGTDFAQRWRRQLIGLDCARVTDADPAHDREKLDPGLPLLTISVGGIACNGALARFLSQAQDAGRPARWMRQGKVLATFYPSADSYSAQPPRDTRDFEAEPADWLWLREPQALARAEQALFDDLINKDTDGYIARFDRRLSVAVSRLLLRTPVTPNQITTASLLLSLWGAAWLAFGSYPLQVLGALLLWWCCILDGCDGEVARLKLMCSRSGANYDLSADHLAHLAVFVAIPYAVRTANPGARVLLPAVLMVSGLAACMFTIWWIILRRPEQHPGPVRIFFERIASRDYVYVVLLLTVIRKLHWFLWAAAFGAHLFNLLLWWLFLRQARTPEPERAS